MILNAAGKRYKSALEQIAKKGDAQSQKIAIDALRNQNERKSADAWGRGSRNVKIVEMVKKGSTRSSIARQYGITQERIGQILAVYARRAAA